MESATLLTSLGLLLDLLEHLVTLGECLAAWIRAVLVPGYDVDLVFPTSQRCCSEGVLWRRYPTHYTDVADPPRLNRNTSVQRVVAERLAHLSGLLGAPALPVPRPPPPMLLLPTDPRLVRRCRRVAWLPAGRLGWYRYEWNRAAERWYGLRGRGAGPLTVDVRRVLPAAVRGDPRTGYDGVDGPVLVRWLREEGKQTRPCGCAGVRARS